MPNLFKAASGDPPSRVFDSTLRRLSTACTALPPSPPPRFSLSPNIFFFFCWCSENVMLSLLSVSPSVSPSVFHSLPLSPFIYPSSPRPIPTWQFCTSKHELHRRSSYQWRCCSQSQKVSTESRRGGGVGANVRERRWRAGMGWRKAFSTCICLLYMCVFTFWSTLLRLVLRVLSL